MWKEILDIALVASGVCGLIWSVIAGFRTSAFIKCAIETTGEVVDFEKSASGGQFGNYDYAPIFRFVTADGKSHTRTSTVGSSPPGFVVGEAPPPGSARSLFMDQLHQSDGEGS